MPSPQFAHLHSHTEHSALDGHAQINDLADYVHSMGQPGFAVTDHGMMSNTYNALSAAKRISKETGEKFYAMPGIEAYVTPADLPMTVHEPYFFSSGSKEDKEERSNDVSAGGAYTHLTLLGETTEGMHNLFKLSTLSWKYGFFKKPRMDVESISQHSKGVIATTGCPSGELQTRLRLGQMTQADEYISKMIDIFGKDNYYVELMDHNMKIPLERQVRSGLLDVAKRFDLPLLATNDLHYVRKADALSHEHMLCIQSGASMHEATYDEGGKRFAFSEPEYYAKNVQEMLELFPEEDFPGAVRNSAEIVTRTTAEFVYDPSLRPTVPLPAGFDNEDDYLRHKVMEGLSRKRPDKVNDPEYLDRLDVELSVFKEKNFSGYMLVVSDFCQWTKNQGYMMGPARGSGGGSLVAFATDIVEIDPIQHGLIFERFLNPERDSPPDIDSDFSEVVRGKVIQYVRDKFGEAMVAMIITFGGIKAKSAIKDIARIYDEPYSMGEELTKALPSAIAGKEITLAEIYNSQSARYPEAEDFRQLAKTLGKEELVSNAMGIENRLRSFGVHAAGVIMSNKPIDQVIPLMMRKADGAIITQFDYPTCEDLGLIKMDFLGLRNLTVISNAIKSIERNHGISINPQEVYDSVLVNPDQKTFDLLNKGLTLGVFQLDSADITNLVKLINVDSFRDISAILALYRPGPMGMNSHINYAERKNGLQPILPIHPEMEADLAPYLSETYNLIVFQEQIQFIAQKIAGYSLGKADILRRAMGKKKKSVLDAEFIPFQSGARERGYSDESINALWDTMLPFAEYGFNKSHSAAYALISYITAYLKANYPSEFMAANLSTLTGDKDKTAVYLDECRRLGITVMPPDVSLSTAEYTPLPNGDVLVGLEAIKGVGEGAATEIHAEAIQNGPYLSIDDFMNRAPSKALTKNVLDGLALSGALDKMGYSRRALSKYLPEAATSFARTQKNRDAGQDTLFDMFDDVEDASSVKVHIVDMPEYNKQDKLMLERDKLGLYVSDHPLSGISDMIGQFSNISAAEIKSGTVKATGFGEDRQKVTVAGVASAVEKKQSRQGGWYAKFEIEDITGSVPCFIFPKAFDRLGALIQNDAVYSISGNVLGDGENEPYKIAVNEITEIKLDANGRIPFTVNLTFQQTSEKAILALQSILTRHHMPKNNMPVHVKVLQKDGRQQTFELAEQFEVTMSADLKNDIREVFGVNCIM